MCPKFVAFAAPVRVSSVFIAPPVRARCDILQTTAVMPDIAAAGDSFGDLAIDRASVVVGPRNHDLFGIANVGTAYVYVRAGQAWSFLPKKTGAFRRHDARRARFCFANAYAAFESSNTTMPSIAVVCGVHLLRFTP